MNQHVCGNNHQAHLHGEKQAGRVKPLPQVDKALPAPASVNTRTSTSITTGEKPQTIAGPGNILYGYFKTVEQALPVSRSQILASVAEFRRLLEMRAAPSTAASDRGGPTIWMPTATRHR